MTNSILPPSIHYGIIIPELKTKNEAKCYLIHLMDYSEFLRNMYIKFRFERQRFHNKAYERRLQLELMDVEKYLDEVEKLMEKL